MNNETPHWKVTLSDIEFGPEEESAVLETLRSRWLSVGARTDAFERAFAGFVGARHAVAVSSGTTALHLAYAAAGLGPGDEVLVPSLTFVATANAARYCGAEPVFVDVIAPEEPLIDPEDVARKITSRTRAIVPVHYAGYACDMDALLGIARDRDLVVIEDGAHAPGAMWSGRPIGSIGDLTAFSFFSNKNMTTGEGGMVTTDDAELADRIRKLRSHGMTTASLDRHRGHAFAYDVDALGWNFRPTEIASALGLVQLSRLEHANALRREVVARYRERLRAIEDLVVPFEGRDAESSCHILPVLLPRGVRRPAVQAALRDEGIQTSMHYPPIHRFREFEGRYRGAVPRTERAVERLLTLPLHPRMVEADVDLVCDALAEAVRAQGSRTDGATPSTAG